MALTILTGSSQAAATNYSYTTSGSSDWSSVPTSSNFYDVIDKVVRYKTADSQYVNAITASFATTALNALTTTLSTSASLLPNDGYIGDTTYGTRIIHDITSVSGSTTSSLATMIAGRNDLTGFYAYTYIIRTEIVGTYVSASALNPINGIGGTLQACYIQDLRDSSITLLGSISQVKNTDFTGTLPEFTYVFEAVGNQNQINLKATGKSGDTVNPIIWTSVSYVTKGSPVSSL